MKFVYYLTCIGKPDLEKKLKILYNNLHYIHNQLKEPFDIIVNCYTSGDIIYTFLKKFSFLEDVLTYNKKGVLTELWLTNPHNDKLDNYDYILFILDDIQITTLDIHRLIDIKKKYKLDIISPKVKNATYSWMQSYKGLTINNALEIFCLLLTPADFKLYASKNSIENKWMWGVDMLFGYFKMKVGVYHKNEVVHMLPSKSDKGIACNLGNKYVQQFGFKSISDVEESIKYVIGEINVD